MDRWIRALRDQVRRIAEPDYRPDPAPFADAPADIVRLSEELDALALSCAERERSRQALTHEVHHRVKNNLQIVISLLKLQARAIADPLSRQPLEQAQIRMGALALIHRLLYQQDDAFSGEGVSIEKLFAGLCAQLRSAFRDREGIDLSYHVESEGVSIDAAIPLILFAVEAVTNAYGHAFPAGRAGAIALDYRHVAGAAVLRIRDDGVGFEPQDGGQSMGRQLLLAFAHQLGGSLTIESATTVGTVVTLTYQA